MTAFAREHEDEFVQIVMRQSESDTCRDLRRQRKELEDAQNRMNRLDTIVSKLYEDNLDGKISDERFARMSAGYDNEQKELERRIDELKAAIDQEEQQTVDVERFLALVRKYTDLQELTAEIVREFIEKIYVYQTQTINGHRVRRIKIVYNCIGEFTAPEQEKTV